MKKYLTATISLPNGKRKYIRAKTQEDLDAKVTRARAELNAGIKIDDQTTFGEFAQTWFDTYKRPILRENSQETLLYILNLYILPALSAYRMRDIKPLHVMQVMSRASHLSRSVQDKIFWVMRAIFQTAVDNCLIVRSPVLSTMKAAGQPKKERVALTVEQSQRLLQATWGTRAYTFCLIALRTGMRRGEILGLMWEDIDFDRRIITVTHNKAFVPGPNREPTTLLKSNAAHRELPIPEDLYAHLLLEKSRSKSPYVLSMKNGESLSQSSFDRLWDLVTSRTTDDPEKLGRSTNKYRPQHRYMLDFSCHPHLLRHTYITRLFEAGLDLKEIQYLAGHSTIEMTLRVYTHYCRSVRAEETNRKVCEAFAPIKEVM